MPSIICEDRLVIPAEVDRIESFRSWTHSDSCPNDIRIDFIDGKIVIDMSPEELFTHGRVKTEFIRVLGNLVHEDRNMMMFTDSTRVAKNEADLSSEPDIVIVSRSRIRSNELRLVRKANQPNRFVEIEGGPDIAIEIVSDSSVSKDKELLPAAHYQAGTLEYWLVDARDEANVQFLIHRRAESDWILDPDEEQRSDVLNASLHLSTMIDEDDWLECTLTANRH